MTLAVGGMIPTQMNQRTLPLYLIYLVSHIIKDPQLIVSVTPGERTSNGLSPLVSVGVRSLSGEPVPYPLMSVLPVGVR